MIMWRDYPNLLRDGTIRPDYVTGPIFKLITWLSQLIMWRDYPNRLCHGTTPTDYVAGLSQMIMWRDYPNNWLCDGTILTTDYVTGPS